MKRKDVIIISAIANAGILIILLISAVTTKDSYLASSSLEVANSILEKDENGMLPIEDTTSILEKEEKIIHKLPKIEESFVEVVVKKGDSLDQIAKFNSISVETIKKINNLSTSFLKEGQILKIPKMKETLSLKNVQEYDYYIIKKGDNPWTIALKHKIKLEKLLKLNNLDEKKARKLKPGDKIRIR